MATPIAFAVLLASSLLLRLSSVRAPAGWSALLAVVAAGAVTVAFSSEPLGLAISWPLIAYFWVAMGWKLLVDGVWRDYLEVRQRPPLPAQQAAPPSEQLLIYAYGTVPTAVGLVALPLFSYLFTRDMSAVAAAGGFTLSAGMRNMPFVVIASYVVTMGIIAGAILFARKKNPWFPSQVKLAHSAHSTGDKRRRLLEEAARLEPQVGARA